MKSISTQSPAAPSSMPTVSVVIGTLNRCHSLPRAIQSLLDQACDPARLEIIVVDNGSTDRTREVAESFAARHSNVRYALEPKLGLSNARNKGIAEARGEFVAFFDDDATAEPQWGDSILKVIADHPDVGATGGPIVVEWPFGKPDWMPASREGYYGHCDYGREQRLLTYPQYPFGSNMIIRRERLLRINGFRDSVGPKGKNMMSAGEQDLFMRLSQHDLKIVYEPQAVVHHWIPAEQVTQQWLLRRALRHGMSNARMLAPIHRARSFWIKQFTVSATRVALSAVATAAGMAARKHPAIVVSRRATMMYWNGIARGSLTNLFSA